MSCTAASRGRSLYRAVENRSFFITVGVSFPDCDKASGGMRTDLQWKVAKATANLAPIPLRAELNIKTLVKYAVSI